MHARTLYWLLTLVAAGCYSDRDKHGGDAPPAAAKHTTRISPQPGESLYVGSAGMRPVGDMDGDGLDEFILSGLQPAEDTEGWLQGLRLYLFYGRTDFPEQLSTADADAMFDGTREGGGPIGDINGDGLGDLLFSQAGSVEFVFGSTKRLKGTIAAESSGAIWQKGELPPPFAPGVTTQLWVEPAGNVDGDSCDDLIVTTTTLLSPDEATEDSGGDGLGTRSYLVRGHRGTWKSATWDPRWAIAGFGFETATLDELPESFALTPRAAGDLDGDGNDDLIADGANGSLIFYGGRDYQGLLSGDNADATLRPASQSELPESMTLGTLLGDVDGDGMSELTIYDPTRGALRFTYGRRWSGELQIEPDLVLEVEVPNLQQFAGVATGDMDGDGAPELVVSVASLGVGLTGPTDEPLVPDPTLYVVKSSENRLRGTRTISASEHWSPPARPPSSAPPGLPVAFNFTLNGDYNGDGTQDVLAVMQSPTPDAEADGSVYLVPSTPSGKKPGKARAAGRSSQARTNE